MIEPTAFIRLTLHTVTVAAALFNTTTLPTMAESSAVQIYADFSARIAYVETEGTLFDDTVERDSGSGLLVGDRFVVTNNHIIPPETNFRKLVVSVRIGSRQAAPLAVVSFKRDPTRDLAVLELSQPPAQPFQTKCPLRLMDQDQSVPVGSSIYVLGFPVDQDISISPGIISNKTGPSGRWQTTTPLNPGNSGGPAFGESGLLVGFAVGGIVRWVHGSDSIAVQGVNFLIPTLTLLNSPLLQDLDGLPAATKCWALASNQINITALQLNTFASTRLNCTISGLGAPTCAQQSLPQGPPEFARSYTVTQVKDDHPNPLTPDYRSYQEKFTAEPNYRIKECRWQLSSANNVDPISCTIDPGGASATLNYRLRSGPAIDRYRGWLFTTVTVRQQREQVP